MKNQENLWVKASGTTLNTLTPESLVKMDREKLGTLLSIETPALPHEREALVKTVMESSKCEGETGRASVEAPLHHCLDHTFVVHTHPPLVNALTCAIDGKTQAADLFPEALWVDYIDPGYTLCTHVHRMLEEYKSLRGCHPGLILLENHGIFVGGDSPEQVHELYLHVMNTLRQRVGPVDAFPSSCEAGPLQHALRAIYGDDAALVERHLPHTSPECLTPDHIVYAKSHYHRGPVSSASIEAFQALHGYEPKVYIDGDRVVALAESPRQAHLAMELIEDAAEVAKGSLAFGGHQTMTSEAVAFIENWEVEAYRQKQMA